jgi:hypothetical protein
VTAENDRANARHFARLAAMTPDHVIRMGDHVTFTDEQAARFDGITAGKAYPVDAVRVAHIVVTADDGGPQWVRLLYCTKVRPLDAAVHLTDQLDLTRKASA